MQHRVKKFLIQTFKRSFTFLGCYIFMFEMSLWSGTYSGGIIFVKFVVFSKRFWLNIQQVKAV